MNNKLEITASALRRLLEEGRPVTVLDVRPLRDRREWSIPNSLHIDAYNALWDGDPNALAGADLPPGVPVVAVCMVGRTSLIAAAQLRSRGLKALSLRGGMRAWSLAWNTASVALPTSTASVIQVRRTGKGCLSYIVGSDGEATVIDASVDPRVYMRIAARNGWRISQVLETHVHADHLSRTRKLARLVRATLRLPAQDRVSYPFVPVSDSETIRVGTSNLQALRTPGHTGESTCYLLDDEVLFTGDTLFLTGMGRPDLAASPEETRARGGMLYRSLHKLTAYPPGTIVVPGHTGAPVPFDGQPISATLGEVRPHLQILEEPEEAFIENVLSRIPPPPANYARIVELNEAGIFPTGDPTELEAGANRCAIA
jgi:glyoxylase-like metal-dependent hydrolase (beta-lactamase superfamily II)/rhodanese-related sulfurtransferase